MTPDENLKRLQAKRDVLRECCRVVLEQLRQQGDGDVSVFLLDLNERLAVMEDAGTDVELSLAPFNALPSYMRAYLAALGIMVLTLQAEEDAAATNADGN